MQRLCAIVAAVAVVALLTTAVDVSCSPVDVVAASRAIDILRSFYHATNGPNWTNSQGWRDLASSDPCKWFGVECEDGSDVTSIPFWDTAQQPTDATPIVAMARRLYEAILVIALIGLLLLASGVDARRRAPKPRKPRVIPILECVVIGPRSYTAYFGYENEDGVPINVTDVSDNEITGFGVDYRHRLPWFFPLWRVIPGRPGRSPYYPNVPFSIELPLYSIGIWRLCGRIILITMWGPRCNNPDKTPPTFTSPAGCRSSGSVSYTLDAVAGGVDAEFTQLFEASDNDREGALSWDNSFDPDEDTGQLTAVDMIGLGSHPGWVKVRDRSGNSRTCTVNVIVRDRQPPILTCPAPFTVPITDPDAQTLLISGGSVTVGATDNNNNRVTGQWKGYLISNPASTLPLTNAYLSGTGLVAAGNYKFGITEVAFEVSDVGTDCIPNSVNTASCKRGNAPPKGALRVNVTDGAKPKFVSCPINQELRVTLTPSVIAIATDTLTRVTLTVVRTFGGVSTPGRIATAACRNQVSLDGGLNANGVPVPFPVGTTTLVFTARDEYNNVQTCITRITITEPTDILTCPAGTTINADAGSQYGTITASASGPSEYVIRSLIQPPSTAQTVLLNVPGTVQPNGHIIAGADVSGRYPIDGTTVSFEGIKTTPLGTKTIVCGTVFRVIDDQPATLTCPAASLTLSTDAGVNYATVPPTLTATASDNNLVQITVDINNGSAVTQSQQATGATGVSITLGAPVTTLALGTYTLRWTATDTRTAVPTPCVTTVTVVDTEAPVITCPSTPLSLTLVPGAEFASVAAAASTAVATDNSGIVSITVNGNASDNAAGTYLGPTLASGATSVSSAFTFIAIDGSGNTAQCSFTIVVNQYNHCPSGRCGNGVCNQVAGSNGVAVSYNCDCTGLLCYASLPDCQSSAAFPFPTPPATETAPVSACDGFVWSAPTSCMSATVDAGNSVLTRSWSLVSTTASSIAIVQGILAAAGSGPSISFSSTELVGGETYQFRMAYTHVSSGTSYIVEIIVNKAVGNTPSLNFIDSPPYPHVVTTDPAVTQFALEVETFTCNGPTQAPISFSWAVSPSVACLSSLDTSLRRLVVPVPCNGLILDTDYVFTATVADGNGVAVSASKTVKLVPPDPQSPICRAVCAPPIPRIGVDMEDPDGIQEVRLPNSNPPCTDTTGGGFGCTMNNIDSIFQHLFDDLSTDPRCGTLSTHWEIFFPLSKQDGRKYTSLGIEGYWNRRLTVGIFSLPNLGVAINENKWRMQVTTTSTAPVTAECPTAELTTVSRFQFIYKDSPFSMLISMQCQNPIHFPDFVCPFAALLSVAPGTPTDGAFAVQAAGDWTYTWSIEPSVPITEADGQGTSVFFLPSGVQPGGTYTIECVATNGVLTASRVVTVVISSTQPQGGSFSVSPRTGAALTQPFILSAPNWQSSSALSYAFKYIVGDDLEGAIEHSLTTLSFRSQSSVLLPAGRITVVSYVYAQDGSFARRTQTIDVVQETAVSRSCWVLNVADTVLTQADNEQDMQKALQLVSYLADYLKAPELQDVTSLECNGEDRTASIQGLRGRFMTLLEKLSTQPLDTTQAAMLTAAMNKVVTNARVTAVTPQEAVSTAALLTNVVTTMSLSAGGTTGAMAAAQSEMLSLVSQLVGMIEDCTVLDQLATDMRTMFVAANARGAAGHSSVSMSAANVAYRSQTVWANMAQSASLGDIVFNLPAAALHSSATDFNINMINYLDVNVRKCRKTDTLGAPVTVQSTVVSVEVVQARDHSVHLVSGLPAPVTFTLPLRADASESSSCGLGSGPLTCAWWDAANNGWSSAGCQTMSTSVSLSSGAVGVSCACSHLTEFAIIRGDSMCPDKSILRGFRGTVAIYVVLFAIVFGLFCRTVRQTRFALRENMLFTFLASVACGIRIALGSHYAEFISFPVGVVDVFAVVPYAIFYWINGHYFTLVRIQRIESTEARVRWRVEPILRLVLVGVFLGMMGLLSGTGMDATSQAKMAGVVSRVIATAYTVSNSLFFGYACTIMLGYAAGRSDVEMTRAMAVMSLATLMETIFWAVYPTSGYAMFPNTVCDLIIVGVLIYRYRHPLTDQKRVSQISVPDQALDEEEVDDVNAPPNDMQTLSIETRSSQLLEESSASPRRNSVSQQA